METPTLFNCEDSCSHSQYKNIQEVWREQEEANFERLQQQRFRMENMTKIIEEYSHIIRMMETENEELKNENESLQRYRKMYEEAINDNSNFTHEYHNVLEKLELLQEQNKELKFKMSIYLDQLELMEQQKAELGSSIVRQVHDDHKLPNLKPGSLYSRSSKKSYSFIPQYPQDARYLSNSLEEQLYKDYTTLADMYQQLKMEMLNIHQENLTLKTVIADQSKLYNEFKFKEGKNEQKNSVTNNNSHKRQRSESEERRSNRRLRRQNTGHSNSNQKQNQYNSPKNCQHNMHDLQRIKQLKKVIKQKQQIILKMKDAEDKQMKVINLLKSQNSRTNLGLIQPNDQNNLLSLKSFQQ